MKLNKYIIGLFIGIAGGIVTSCSDFLDELPDTRAELKNPSSIKKLLVNGYSEGDYSLVAELSGDNVIDNNSPNYDVDEKDDAWGIRYNLSAYSRMDDELFAWQDVKSDNGMDSPYKIWDSYYKAISVANHALEAVQKLRKEGGLSVEDRKILDGCEAEALLIRAYHHFVLVNIFSPAYRDENLSSNKQTELGIPYVTIPETTVHVNYERLSVAEVYKKIGEDLRDAFKLLDAGAQITDANSKNPKYHFGKQSANAFAAQYYLFIRDYDKVISHATEALGDDPASQMREWKKFDGMTTTDATSYEWVNKDSKSNYMMISTYSQGLFHFSGPYRYACNRSAAAGSIRSFGPTWNVSPHPIFNIQMIATAGGKEEYGVLTAKTWPIFETTDKMANIGYAHFVRREFTAEKTLLCRAEAYIYKNNLPAALEDLKILDSSRQNVPDSYIAQQNWPKELTDEDIRKFYRSNKDYVKPLHNEDMSPSFKIDTNWMPYVHCVLHFRRMETIFEGDRWFDIKRYGIEIVRRIGKDKVDTLTWNDPRRAIQIPQEAISAGMQPNNR